MTAAPSIHAGAAADPPVDAPLSSRHLYALRALGKADLPENFTIDNTTYRRERTTKHDFFAATGFYLSETNTRVVLKMGRTQDYAGLPLAWLGKWLCDREVRFYARCA